MGTPHKHAELIKQWAEDPSKKVWMRLNEKDMVWEESHISDVISDLSSSYIYCVGSPKRLTPVVRWLWADRAGWVSNQLLSDEEAHDLDFALTKLEWSRTEFPQ